jgi:large subunit ribosomal protein L18
MVSGAPTRGSARQKRHERVRLSVTGTGERPRLSVFRSVKQIYAQLIDDTSGRTVASASSLEPDLRKASGSKTERARSVGALLGQRATKAGVKSIVFDRAGFRYHGRVRSLAEGAREAGLDF